MILTLRFCDHVVHCPICEVDEKTFDSISSLSLRYVSYLYDDFSSDIKRERFFYPSEVIYESEVISK